jgi:hypothetical protein
MMPLFLDQAHKPTFQKIAMPVKLSQSPEAWQRDIAGEIYKQLPYIGDYAVNVILDRVDAQRGYGFGSIHISNKTDAQMQDQTEQPSIRIPVVIRDYLMAPLDTFMDGSGVYPLTETRLREKLFRPQTLELSTRKPSDKGLVDQLYPPMRSNYGMGSLGGDSMGMGKMADAFFTGLGGISKSASDAESGRRAMVSRLHAEAAANKTHLAGIKCASLVEAIAMTLSEKDKDQLVDQITNDAEIKIAALKNPGFQKLAMIIASANPPGINKTAQALVDNIKPNVVQFEKLASGFFRVKWANSNAFSPKEDVVPAKDANQMAGTDLSKMDAGATVTVSSERAKKQSLDEPVYVKVQQFGKYCVQDMNTNQELCGWVIPIVDLEMHPMEMYVFIDPGKQGTSQGGVDSSNPSQPEVPGASGTWSVQDEIAGKPMDTGNGFEELQWANNETTPNGTGFFVSLDGQCCLLPMTINNSTQDPSGVAGIMGETLFGEPVQLQIVPGLRQVQMMNEGSYGIPDNLTWVPLPGEPTFLAKDPLDIAATQQAQQMPNQVQVGSSGPGEFSMEGQPLSKVAQEDRQFIKKAQAEFLLVAMGVDPLQARGILKKAEESRNWIKCATARPITSLASLHSEMTKKAASDIANFPYHLRQNLVKEASVIDDADTADKVLAMNFINPENVDTYAKYLPELDEASKKLAELLLAVRLGIGSVDEGAVERAMKGLETVIEGLKLLQQKVSA